MVIARPFTVLTPTLLIDSSTPGFLCDHSYRGKIIFRVVDNKLNSNDPHFVTQFLNYALTFSHLINSPTNPTPIWSEPSQKHTCCRVIFSPVSCCTVPIMVNLDNLIVFLAYVFEIE